MIRRRVFPALMSLLAAARHSVATAQQPISGDYLGTFQTSSQFESYLSGLKPGDPVNYQVGGRSYTGIYNGQQVINGQNQHVAINVVEVPSGAGQGAGPAAGTPGTGQGQPGQGGLGNPGSGPALDMGKIGGAAAAAATGQAVYRLFFVSPELEARIAEGQANLANAQAQTRAAITAYNLVVESSFQQATTSLKTLSEAIASSPIAPPPDLLRGARDTAIKFSTSNAELDGSLTGSFYRLTNAPMQSPLHRDARSLGIAALSEAEAAASKGDIAAAKEFARAAEAFGGFLRQSADLLVGLDPVSGLVRDSYELLSGNDLITGAELTDTERAIRAVSAGANLATLGAFPVVFGGVKVIRKLASRVRLETAERIFKVVDGLPFTKHGMDRFLMRGEQLLINSTTKTTLTPAWIKRTFAEGQSYWDFKNKTVAFVSQAESGKWLHVSVSKYGQPRITTVIVKDDPINLAAKWKGKPRFVPYDYKVPTIDVP